MVECLEEEEPAVVNASGTERPTVSYAFPNPIASSTNKDNSKIVGKKKPRPMSAAVKK